MAGPLPDPAVPSGLDPEAHDRTGCMGGEQWSTPEPPAGERAELHTGCSAAPAAAPAHPEGESAQAGGARDARQPR